MHSSLNIKAEKHQPEKQITRRGRVDSVVVKIFREKNVKEEPS
jgi:hypothetical protein